MRSGDRRWPFEIYNNIIKQAAFLLVCNVGHFNKYVDNTCADMRKLPCCRSHMHIGAAVSAEYNTGMKRDILFSIHPFGWDVWLIFISLDQAFVIGGCPRNVPRKKHMKYA